MHIGLDHGAVLVGAVIVGRDAAGAVVDALADIGIAQIGQVVRLRAVSHDRVLDLDEVADMHLASQLRAGAQARERADQCTCADADAGLLAVDMRERVDHRAGTEGRVGNHAVGADAHAFAELDPALEDAVDIDLDILAADQLAAQVEARRVGQAHARDHQLVGAAALVGALELGQLGRAVDAGDLHRVADPVPEHARAVGDRELHDVGQVVLVLGVAVVESRQPAAQQAGRHRHDAAVDLGDAVLRVSRVLVLDDGLHVANRVAHDAAVAGRVGHLQRQQCQVFTAADLQQRLQRLGPGQRHIARQHQRDAVISQHRQRLLHRVAGAELGLLAHELQRQLCAGQRGQGGLDLFSAVAGDHYCLTRLDPGRAIDHMGRQGPARQALQHLGAFAFHARTLAGRHDHYIHGKAHKNSRNTSS